MGKSALLVALLAIWIAFLPEESFAQVQAQFSYDAVVNCAKPNLRNHPIHGEGTGKLSTDRSASLDFHSNVSGRETYNVKLGGPAAAAREGSASLRVLSRKSLRAVRDYPNNTVIVDLMVVGTSCTIKIANRLKPGKSQYTFTTPFGLAYCDKPQIIKTSCTSI
jgi:hypothetical protein